MDIHIAQRVVSASADKVSVIVVANYSGDEQQVLEATQNWHTPCVKKRYSFEKSIMWRGTFYFQPKYCELVVPGLLIDNFTLEYAGKFEEKFRKEVEPEIQNNLFELVRKYQLTIRDMRFGTSSLFSSFGMPPMIDVTPQRISPTPLTLPPPSMQSSFTAQSPQPFPTFAAMQKQPLRSIPIASYSRINLLDYADPNMTAPRGERANVQKMTWHFLDPEHEDDHSIKLFLSFSDEDIGIIERFGMDDDPVVTEPVFSDEAVERLKRD